jgi:hypothetical protein
MTQLERPASRLYPCRRTTNVVRDDAGPNPASRCRVPRDSMLEGLLSEALTSSNPYSGWRRQAAGAAIDRPTPGAYDARQVRKQSVHQQRVTRMTWQVDDLASRSSVGACD